MWDVHVFGCVFMCQCLCVCVCGMCEAPKSCQGGGVTGLRRLESSFPESFSWWLHWQLKLVTAQMGTHAHTHTFVCTRIDMHIHRHSPEHTNTLKPKHAQCNTHQTLDDHACLTSHCTGPFKTHTHTHTQILSYSHVSREAVAVMEKVFHKWSTTWNRLCPARTSHSL